MLYAEIEGTLFGNFVWQIESVFANDKCMFNLKFQELVIILGKLIEFSFLFSMFSGSEANMIYFPFLEV
jgi:hypothetical protein